MTSKKKKSEAQVEVTTEPVVEDKIIKVKSDESPRFTLTQLAESNRYRKYAYLLEIKLDANEKYTLAEVDELISGLI